MLKKAQIVFSALLITLYIGSTNKAFAQTPSATAFLSLEPRNQYACVATYSNAVCSSYNPECLDRVLTIDPTPTPIEITPTFFPISPLPTESPALLPTVTPEVVSPAPSPIPESKPVTLNPDIIFALVNEYRVKARLPAFEKDDQVCEIANSRKPEFAGEIATGAIHAGMRARKLQFWISENMKYGGNEQEMLNWWLASPIHRASIFGGYKYSCVACEGTTCNQLFTSFTPKEQ